VKPNGYSAGTFAPAELIKLAWYLRNIRHHVHSHFRGITAKSMDILLDPSHRLSLCNAIWHGISAPQIDNILLTILHSQVSHSRFFDFFRGEESKS
jgi:hypothetical protein